MPRRGTRMQKKGVYAAMDRVGPHQRYISLATPKARVVEQPDAVGKTLSVDTSFTTDNLDTHDNVQKFMVRLSLTCANAAVQVGNLCQLFDLVQFYAGMDPKNAYRTYRGDELYVLEGLKHSMASDPREREDTNFWGRRGNWGESLQVGETRDFYIRFPNHPLEGLGVSQSGAFRIKFNLRKDCVLSGSAANVSIAAFEIIFFENNLDSHEGANSGIEQARREKVVGPGVGIHYLDVQQEEKTGETFTAGTEKSIDFTVDGHCPGQVVLIRPADYSTTGGSALTNMAYLGKDALISITRKGHGKKNILTDDGGTVTLRELQQMSRIPFAEDSGALFIPYSPAMISDMFSGTHGGGFNFKGEEYSLRITPAPAATDAVFTFNCTNAANDGGSYRLGWAGEWTAPLAYNANVAAMKAAFEGLRVMQDNDLTATFSATAATDFTVTISGAPYDVNRRFGLPTIDALTLADGGVIDIVTVTNSTAFQDGSNVGGGSFDVVILSWSWHRMGVKGGAMAHQQIVLTDEPKKN